MPSIRKIETARANGAKSRGPKTGQGRRKSSMNAIKHGLTAQTLVLPNEDPDEYRQMLDSYVQHFQPVGQIELDLIQEMAAAKWRQERLWAVETEFLAQKMQEQEARLDTEYPAQEIARLTLAFRALAATDCLSSISRTEARLERAYSRALRNLLQVQAVRKSSAAAPRVPPPRKQILQNEPRPAGRRAPIPSPIAADPVIQPEPANEKLETALHFTANGSAAPKTVSLKQ
jgi:hypothetical protein